MSKRNELYKCSESGQIVEVLVGGECGVAGMEHVVEIGRASCRERV